ncbi:RNP-1 like RNA-binding protein [Bacteroides coprosuis DSM 18011]|uniref:RNP-1 like RNA-binding protein n=1 Tax=Bacteroides coprosuis DSM 18011 TaxID=679937 RepID=F3ZS54_9BACE|nr:MULTISPECIES: RNA-binding protein [Bacteroides]EGJ72075.1 RNP-1 like RNA-binding protein [Bacteroides coprosuis DSM 18011]HJD92953.1 RNA-binding protein [Bacteroides coprosuis]
MNIFIGGLSYGITDADLMDLFQEYGEIKSAKVIMDRETNKSKGFGFVEMEDDSAAKNAISELNGAEYDGRTISVSEARPREERPRRSFNGGGNRRSGGGFNRGGGDRRY